MNLIFGALISALAMGTVACGKTMNSDANADAGALDTAGSDASLPDSCSSLPAASDLNEWRAATVEWIREQGYPGTTSEVQSGESARIRGFRWPLPASDIGPVVIAWLIGLPNFPAPVASELVVLEFKQVFEDSGVLIVGREHVGDVETRFFRPLASVNLSRAVGGDWHATSLTVWGATALLTEATAIELAACSPSDPPSDSAARATTFTGINMRECAVVGSYDYLPNTADQIDFDDGLDWVARDGFWVARRTGTLRVVPENYWENIVEADCYCREEVGFKIEVDATTGTVLKYTAGISCIVC